MSPCLRRTAVLFPRPALGAGLLVPSACLLLIAAGCSYHPAVCGLRPFSPGVVVTTASDSPVFTEVDSLQPELRWEAFPRPSDLRADTQGLLGRARDVTYDLRIWRLADDGSPTKVYERAGLPAPEHRLEEMLQPSAKYYWSVRARFRVDGETRAIPWGFSKVPPIPRLKSCILPGNIPPRNHYRFETPAK